MKRLKKFLSASKLNVAVFVLATSLVLAATIGAASATIVYLAETYTTRVDMYDIGVSLLENGERVSWCDYMSASKDGSWDEASGTLLENMLGNDEKLALGKTYEEKLSVHNSGTLDETVQVEVYRYWVDGNGNKRTNLNPTLIELNFCTGNGWIIDPNYHTDERTVLYYNGVLKAGDTTPLFIDKLTISNNVATIVDQNGNYIYDGMRFIVEVRVSATQETRSEDFVLGAWSVGGGIGPDGSMQIQ